MSNNPGPPNLQQLVEDFLNVDRYQSQPGSVGRAEGPAWRLCANGIASEAGGGD